MQKNRANMHLFCIITRFWCGRQELKTPIYSKSPLFIRHSSTERQSERQKFLRLLKTIFIVSQPINSFAKVYSLGTPSI